MSIAVLNRHGSVPVKSGVCVMDSRVPSTLKLQKALQ